MTTLRLGDLASNIASADCSVAGVIWLIQGPKAPCYEHGQKLVSSPSDLASRARNDLVFVLAAYAALAVVLSYASIPVALVHGEL